MVYVSLKYHRYAVLTYIARRGANVVAHLGSRIASTIALAHAHVPLLVLFPYQVRGTCGERAAVANLRLKYTTGGVLALPSY